MFQRGPGFPSTGVQTPSGRADHAELKKRIITHSISANRSVYQ